MTDIMACAVEAAAAWGPLARPPRLIGERENAVFEVEFTDATRAALRLHRAGYQSATSITSELLWTEALAENGFPCPQPLRSKTGSLTATLEGGQLASAVSWIDATCIGENGVPLVGDGPALYEKLGKLIRQMHDLTDQIDTSGMTRPSWKLDALLGDDPHWGRFWLNPALSADEQELLQAARKNAAQQLNRNNTLSVGLIHADILQENILQNECGLHLIDFDDCGTGYRLFDLGTALVQHEDDPNLGPLTDGLCAGYGCAPDLMPLFIMLRGLASCGWIISRAPATDPRQRLYAERALRCATRYLAA
ncbi:MAG: phosphotransferase [Pseudomonadota bacterium]